MDRPTIFNVLGWMFLVAAWILLLATREASIFSNGLLIIAGLLFIYNLFVIIPRACRDAISGRDE